MTSVTAGLHSSGLDNLFVSSINLFTSDHKDLMIMKEHFTRDALLCVTNQKKNVPFSALYT